MVATGFIDVHDIIVGKSCRSASAFSLYIELLRLQAYRTVRGHGKQVPEGRLQDTGSKHLPDHFQRVDGFLGGLRGEAVHQVGMYHNACFGKVCGSPVLPAPQ